MATNERTISIAITGAGGRMGRRLAALAVESGHFQIVGACEAAGNDAIGQDLGLLAGGRELGVKVTPDLPIRPDVLIDFSLPEGTMYWLARMAANGVPTVIGTTGLDAQHKASIAQAAHAAPIVHSANMSVGVNVLLKLVAQAAKALGSEYDIEITEAHHRFKKDAPSGTALALAASICDAMKTDPAQALVHGRQGNAPRKPGQIGMHAVRLGDTVGEHSVFFGNLGETVTISHSAHTRDTFARGALRAAAWLVGRKPGLYTMTDVLGLQA
jgi:4-hydroxy-tetrahydrodipicolinate reductase